MGYADYMGPPAGGSVIGYVKGNSRGFVNSQTEGAWTATFVFFILYLLFLLLSPYYEAKALKKEAIEETPPMTEAGYSEENRSTRNVEAGHGVETTATGPSTTYATTEGHGYTTHGAGESRESRTGRVTSRMLDLGCAFRDGFLILLGTSLITMAGFGFTGGPLVLTWIVFGLLCVWSLAQLISHHLLAGILELTTIFISAVLLIIAWGLAWRV